LLHFLSVLKKRNRIPDVPMYLNSPMATSVTETLHQFRSLHKLSDEECEEIRDVVRYVQSADESKMLNMRKAPMLIISASGMATGGRILHHLKEFAPDPKSTIVLTGFQAAGTRGRSLQDGAREIKIHGQFVPVRAQVTLLENLSAHADYGEIVEWLTPTGAKPRKVFVTHGETKAARSLCERLTETFGWDCEAPQQGDEFPLE
ncbi:MAG TPA: MBL fold metallo-hydrolase RNA specificity domain-containing protein, partial [Bdellovibrionales bacterium]|nr:MBL fold metallo-hydrolase RNA specificity domain-containing protein [Bdellovibrionales bacterium]